MSQLIKSQKCPYPVGAIAEFTIEDNPNTIWPYTNWQPFGAGRTTISKDATQEDFDTVGKIGGSKSHVMTLENLISHTHNVPSITAESTAFNEGGGSEHRTNSTGTAQGIESESAGSATPEAIPTLSPYIVVRRWERIA